MYVFISMELMILCKTVQCKTRTSENVVTIVAKCYKGEYKEAYLSLDG